MFNIVLYQPEIPPNTGNIIRLCAVTGCALHLIKPLGFSIENKDLRRAGLDYELQIPMKTYESFEEYLSLNVNSNSKVNSKLDSNLNSNLNISTLYLCSTKAKTPYHELKYKIGDSFIFGPETRGLPKEILDTYPENQKIRIPMLNNARSLNLANSVSIIVYEAWRQLDFSGIE